MRLSEIITLSKAGFKAAEIRKMMIDAENDEQPDDPAPDADEPGTDPAPDDQEDDQEDPEGDQDEPEEEIDYKALYLEEKAKRDKAQKDNSRKEQPQQPDDDEIIKNLINEFL